MVLGKGMMKGMDNWDNPKKRITVIGNMCMLIIRDSWKGKLWVKEIKKMCFASLNRIMNKLC